jgi:hypothetical protein
MSILPDRNNESGIALITVLWILALLSALVASMAISAHYHVKISGALDDLGQSQDLANAGVQAWMAQLRADAISKEQGVIITEIMQFNPASSPIRINEIDAADECGYGEAIELYNRSGLEVDLSGWQFKDTADGQDGKQLNTTIGPNEFKIINPDISYGMEDGGTDIGLFNASGKKIDQKLGWNDQSPGESIQAKQDGTNNWQQAGCTMGSENEAGQPTWAPPDKGEYIEVYNTNKGGDAGDTITLTDFSLKDDVPSNTNNYDLVVHPDYPYAASQGEKLKPGQVGIIADTNVSLSHLGIDTAVSNDEVRLYTTELSGTKQFLTNGLNNSQLENISLEDGSGNGDEVLSSGSWPPAVPELKISRFNAPLGSENIKDNWPESGKGGTPGEVNVGVDHFDERWGWGGEIVDGIPMTSKVFLPSLKSSYQPGDIGYFKITNIEDESGKINLLADGRNPDSAADRSKLYIGNDLRRANITEGDAKAIINFANENIAGDSWASPGDFFTADENVSNPGTLLAGGLDVWLKRRHVYTGSLPSSYPDTKSININTAPYEALRSIPISANEEHFVTEKMAKELIEFRSGDAVSENSNTNITIPQENYQNNNEPTNPYNYSTARSACDLSTFKNEGDFNCDAFSKYVRTNSAGIFRVIVRGVAVDSSGDTQGSTKMEAMVDRTGLTDGSGDGMKVIYKRTY